jgi:ABC-type multidrug transport system ATPase subunit
LCNPDGVDISEALSQVTGPGVLNCEAPVNGTGACLFNEGVLDTYFVGGTKLNCNSGECIAPEDIPVPDVPKELNLVGIIAGSVSALVIIIALILLFIYYVRKQKALIAQGEDADDEAEKLLEGHIPAVFVFENVGYKLKSKAILSGVSGIVYPGQLMAIMGGSGAGKTTCLDILAGKSKRGETTGNFYINGVNIDPKAIRKYVGYVDQEDRLLGTLTVRESLMYSALLRLPKSMSLEAKKVRVQQTLEELGIEKIADKKIGVPGVRGISGGEKRRVSIAQELVTSPSILFLDEPTSGLDAYNAYIVIETLSRLAKNYNRTIIFTIHQPRSNIFDQFSRLLLLASGRMMYSGPCQEALPFFNSIGYTCPVGHNVADHLIDITMKKEDEEETVNENDVSLSNSRDIESNIESASGSEKRGRGYSNASNKDHSPVRANEKSHLLSGKPRTESTLNEAGTSNISFFKFGKKKDQDQATVLAERDEHQLSQTIFIKDTYNTEVERRIDSISEAFVKSMTGETLFNSISETLVKAASENQNRRFSVRHTVDTSKRLGKWQQFTKLSGRTLLNLYRDPFLLLSHYVINIIFAVFIGSLFWQLGDTIAGFQSRLGCLFFICSFFGFGSLSSLELFASERLLFLRERSNGFYSPIPYFFAKVFFDILPLRVIPPVLFGSIVYYMVGFYADQQVFLQFLLVLVLFNLATAAQCLMIAMLFKSSTIANLVASLTMLLSMLFGGILLNKSKKLTLK